MKKLSKFQLILLLVFGAMAIAGILIFSLAVGGGTSNSIGAVTIWGPLDQNAFSVVIRQAAENDPNLSQVSYVQKDADTYEQDLTDALASGTGPDLFLLRQDYAVKDAGKVAVIPPSSLSKSQFESTFVDAASPFYTEQGAIGIPLLIDPLVLYWNKDLLATSGFAQPPKYWDEVYNIAQNVSKKNDAGGLLKSGIAFGEYRNIANAKDILAALILQAGGTITTFDSTGKLVPNLVPKAGAASQATVSALRFYTEFADPSKIDYSWSRALPEAQSAFAAGDVGLYVGYASEEPQIAKVNPNLNFAVAPLPQVRPQPTSIDAGHVYALAAARAGKNPSAALTAAYLIANAANSQSLSLALGIPAARRDVLSQPAQGDDDLFNKMAIIARSWVDPDPKKTASIFQDMIENTTSGAALPSEAVSRADQELGHLLGL